MDGNYEIYLNKVLTIFNKTYLNAYDKLNSRRKDKLSIFIPTIFRRWYYSAFMEETTLSPANIIYCLNKVFDVPGQEVPHIRYSYSNDKKILFDYEIVSYSLENHPIINDAKRIMEHCHPIINLDEDNYIVDYTHISGLNIHEKNYANFLVAVLIKCGLLKKVPSINTCSYQPSRAYKSFFKNDSVDILRKFVNAAIDLFVEDLAEFLPIGRDFKNAVSKLLEKPQNVDELFEDFFSSFGLNIEDALNIDYEEMDFDNISQMQQALVAGTFFVGVSLDKNFLTPFSYYFQFIRPLYIVPLDMPEELSLLSDAVFEPMAGIPSFINKDNGNSSSGNEDETDMTLFAPCSQYILTELGEAFQQKINENKRNIENMKPSKPKLQRLQKPDVNEYRGFENLNMSEANITKLIDQLGMIFPKNIAILQREILAMNKLAEPSDIYQMKIKIMHDKRYWQAIEFSSKTTITVLHGCICFAFNLDSTNPYAFYPNGSKNAFGGYGTKKASEAKGKKKPEIEKSNKTEIGDLNLVEGQKLLYIIYNTIEPYTGKSTKNINSVEFEIEVARISSPKDGVRYPNTTKISKCLLEQLEKITR